MTPSIKRARTFVLRAFSHAKQVVFHALVEVRVRKGVGKSVSKLVDKLKRKGMGPWAWGMGSKTEATVIVEGSVASTIETRSTSASTLSQQSEQATEPSQQDAIPAPSAPQPAPSSTEDEEPLVPRSSNSDLSEVGFPPITRRNFYKHPIFWARFLGYAIPLSFLLYVLYLNYLPFGYHKTFTINVGSPNDTKVSEFYLEPSKDLSDRMTAEDGTTYRELNGMATAVFKPNAVLKDAEITVSVEGGEGISLIPPVIDFDPDSVEWDYNWDFSKGVPEGLINVNDRAFAYEGGTYFDGTAKVEMASSSDMFEDGSFTIYVEWMPTDNTKDFQEIVGHYNWELVQNKDSIQFQVGRMNNATGTFYAITYPVERDFFNKKHLAIAEYEPNLNGIGYVVIYIDNKFAGATSIRSDSIWKEYNGGKNLSIGKSEHGSARNFNGYLNNVKFSNHANFFEMTNIKYNAPEAVFAQIPIITNTSNEIRSLILHAEINN